MSMRARRRSPKAAALICSSLVLGLAGLAAAPAAQAGQDTFAYSLGYGGQQTGARHTLVSVTAYSSRGNDVSAGASYNQSGSPLYANWDYGTGTACHYYGAGNMLYPVIRNLGPTTTIVGTSTYGSGAAGC